VPKKAMETFQDTVISNKNQIRRLYVDCLNKQEFELLQSIIDKDYVGIGNGKGPAAFAESVKGLFHAFPQLQFTIEDLFGEANKVVVRWYWEAVNQNPFRGYPASFANVQNNGIVIYEFNEDHKVIRSWLQNERLEVLQQLGIVKI
jgi:predicted ester cyclase